MRYVERKGTGCGLHDCTIPEFVKNSEENNEQLIKLYQALRWRLELQTS
jgi:Zn ribbon nucleic-acid-binding protein